jgi:hypothetical protein
MVPKKDRLRSPLGRFISEGPRRPKPAPPTLNRRLVPDHKIAKAFSVHPRTILRWAADPTLDFPKSITINGRRHRDLDEMEAWIARRREIDEEKEHKPATEAAE